MRKPIENQDWQEGAVTVFVPFCEDQIGYHRENIRKLKRMSWLIGLSGVGLTILAFVIFRSDTKQISENLFKLGPMLLAAPFPAFGYGKILSSQQAVSSYSTWKKGFQSCLQRNTVPPEWLTNAVISNMGDLAKPR